MAQKEILNILTFSFLKSLLMPFMTRIEHISFQNNGKCHGKGEKDYFFKELSILLKLEVKGDNLNNFLI
jgi:ribonuclease I